MLVDDGSGVALFGGAGCEDPPDPPGTKFTSAQYWLECHLERGYVPGALYE